MARRKGGLSFSRSALPFREERAVFLPEIGEYVPPEHQEKRATREVRYQPSQYVGGEEGTIVLPEIEQYTPPNVSDPVIGQQKIDLPNIVLNLPAEVTDASELFERVNQIVQMIENGEPFTEILDDGTSVRANMKDPFVLLSITDQLGRWAFTRETREGATDTEYRSFVLNLINQVRRNANFGPLEGEPIAVRAIEPVLQS